MLTRTRTIHHETPIAIAIVLGPLGSHPLDTTMERYGRWYCNRQCSVILSSSPPIRFVLNRSLQPTAREVLQQTYRALQTTPSHTPVVMHSFSNGGAFLLEAIERELCTSKGSSSNNIYKESDALVASRLRIGYQLFDSCPCYIRTIFGGGFNNHNNNNNNNNNNMTQLEPPLADAFPHPHLSKLVRTIYTTLSTVVLSTWCYMTTLSVNRRPLEFWNHMVYSTACRKQIYMYTTADLLTDAAAIDQLIHIRRHKTVANSMITAYRFTDSNHCRLDIDHPVEYGTMIDTALSEVTSSSSSSLSSSDQ